MKAYEITLRGSSDSVVLISKAELESWQETLDIISNKEEISAVRKARLQKKTMSHKNMLRALGIGNGNKI